MASFEAHSSPMRERLLLLFHVSELVQWRGVKSRVTTDQAHVLPGAQWPLAEFWRNLTDVNTSKRGGSLEDISDTGCYDMPWAPVALGTAKSVDIALANHRTSKTICFLSGFYLKHNPRTTSILLVVVCTGQQSPLFLFGMVDTPSSCPNTYTLSAKPQRITH